MPPTFSKAGVSLSAKNLSQSPSEFHHSTTQNPSPVAPAAWATIPCGLPLSPSHPSSCRTASYLSMPAPENCRIWPIAIACLPFDMGHARRLSPTQSTPLWTHSPEMSIGVRRERAPQPVAACRDDDGDACDPFDLPCA